MKNRGNKIAFYISTLIECMNVIQKKRLIVTSYGVHAINEIVTLYTIIS